MLRWYLRDLQHGPVSTTGQLERHDPVWDEADLRLLEPVIVEGELQSTDDGAYLWRGHVHSRVAGDCRRCLAEVSLDIDDDIDVVFSADPELAEDPGVYPISPRAELVDVTTAVREELLLRVSAFPLCRPECKGLCAECGADLNAGACLCTSGSNH